MTEPDEALRLLVVSSSNTCRSPMAAALLNQAIGRAQVPAVVDSAGLESGGRQPHAHAALALQQYGLTI
ncbi:MAG: low molecular weight phosphotyrosine protein phosphatase, partial [Acidimicrobiia bacterium]|nr:low molecular weight phosphotyrosine protein phosphatase [Acidimicrobiia bacterium]